MYLYKLYSNNPEIFPPIDFNRGLNVVLAKVKRREDTHKDSHNVGKSLLIDLLEFVLLKTIESEHFLKKHLELFHGFDFYLALGLCDGSYLTTKRKVDAPSKISFKKHDRPEIDFTKTPDDDWDHDKIPLRRAVALLDSYLALTAIKGWSIRKGVSYFLRNQYDYRDPFQISKYVHGDHKDWKPYLARVLGLDDSLLSEKYGLDDQLDATNQEKRVMAQGIIHGEDEYDTLKGMVGLRRHDLQVKSRALDDFDFHQQELELNEKLVTETEARIAELNSELYNVRFDLNKIRTSLESRQQFRLNNVQRIFEESSIHFPDALLKDYEELVTFNKKISKERNLHLRARAKELTAAADVLEKEHRAWSTRRKSALQTLRGRESLRKYKDLQKSMDNDRAELTLLESQMRKLEAVIEVSKKIGELSRRRDMVRERISAMTRAGSPMMEKVRLAFENIIDDVLGVQALLSLEINNEGNVEFKTSFLKRGSANEVTSEDRGTTYKKLLCMAFDLAVLESHKNDAFYRFVYHDGALETLDDRKKLRLLDVIRRSCTDNGIQYILSAIEDDLPRDPQGRRVEFSSSEIVREFHDKGDDGRLFRMPKF